MTGSKAVQPLIDEDAVGMINSGNADLEIEDRDVDKYGKSCLNPFARDENGEGGLSWFVVLAAFIVQFNILGMMNNFGTLKGYWVITFGITNSQASLPGSLSYGVMFFGGILSTALVKRIGYTNLHLLGVILTTASLIACSFSKSIMMVYITYGVLFGLGASFLYFGTIFAQTSHFSVKLSLVNGIVSAGSGAGTMAYSIFIDQVCYAIGWENGLRAFSLVIVGLTLLTVLYKVQFLVDRKCKTCCLCRVEETQKRDTERNCCESFLSDLFDFSSLRNIHYDIVCVSCILLMFAYLIPMSYVKEFAENSGVTSSHASKLIGYSSIASLFGRIILGKIGSLKRVNVLYLYSACLMMMGFSNILSGSCNMLWKFVIYVSVFGFFEGGYVALLGAVVLAIIGESQLTAALGLLFAIKSFPIVLGPPLAGVLHQRLNNFSIMFGISGAVIIVASLVLLIVPCIPGPKKGAYRATNCSPNKREIRAQGTLSSEDEPDVRVNYHRENSV